MKHGRRHNRLKEQAYLDRKDAEGYARPYAPIPVAEPDPLGSGPAPAEPLALADALPPKAKRALRRAGLE